MDELYSEDRATITEEQLDYILKGRLRQGVRRFLYCSEWRTEEEPTPAERLASQYHAECDAYDKQVCTGERNGEPMPVTPEEFGAINRHSREVRQRLLRENPGITEKQLHEAIVGGKER